MIGVYARVSTEEQARNGYSLQDQIRECIKKAGTEDVIKYTDEGLSGEFLDRPALTKLRKDVHGGIIKKVVCLDPDRLSRKLINQLIISDEIEKKAEIVFVNGEYQQTPEGMLFFQMRGAISEFEKAKIKERMGRGRREKARQGKVVRDYMLYGYDYDRETQQFIINEEEAQVVRHIFNLFTEKNKIVQGINGIANYLTSQGIPTKRGAAVWHRQVVRQVLMNRAYIGEFYQNRWNTEGMMGNKYKDSDQHVPMRERPKEDWILVPCPAIIEEEVFTYAKNLLQESRRRWAGTSKNQYLLSGLVRCGICGNTMTGRRTKNWGKYIYEYSDIKNTSGAKNRGCGRRIKTEDLDKMVWNTVISWLNQPEEIAAEEQNFDCNVSISYEEAEMTRIEKRLGEIGKGRNNLINLLATAGDELGDSALEETREKLRQLKEEEGRLSERKAELQQQKDFKEQNIVQRSLLREALEYYLTKAPEEITFHDRRELIRYVVREIRIFENEVNVYGF